MHKPISDGCIWSIPDAIDEYIRMPKGMWSDLPLQWWWCLENSISENLMPRTKPQWATFVKTIYNSQGNKKSLFVETQEGVKKNVERVMECSKHVLWLFMDLVKCGVQRHCGRWWLVARSRTTWLERIRAWVHVILNLTSSERLSTIHDKRWLSLKFFSRCIEKILIEKRIDNFSTI